MYVCNADARTTAILPALAATALRVVAQRERRQSNRFRHIARKAEPARALRLTRKANCHAMAAAGLLAEVAA